MTKQEIKAKIKELETLYDSYEVPIHLKTKKPTTNADELETIYENTGDQVIEDVVKIRSIDTVINNYIPNWKPHRDGRVHPTWSFSPPTGQLATSCPNCQNSSPHSDNGKAFRNIIVAPSGYTFLEADKKSFHVATMGYVANDKDYIRFSQIDPHSILGSYIDPSVLGFSIDLKWSDTDILEAAKEFKKRCKEHKAKDPLHNIDIRQELAKPTVLGNQLELGARKLQHQNRKFIKTIGEAEALQGLIAGLFDKPTIYKREIKNKAFLQRFLVNEWGRIQYFYDVFNFQYSKKLGKWIRKDGEGAREPIAFMVQSTAFGMITDELLRLEGMGVCEEHNWIMTVHDSLVFMPEIKKLDKCIEVVASIMNSPSLRLKNAAAPNGLRVGVEIKVGPSWAAMEEIGGS